MVVAQIGLDAAAAGYVGILYCVWLSTILAYLLFLVVWFLPEIVGLIRDWIVGRDLLAESELERKYEGRLFGPSSNEE